MSTSPIDLNAVHTATGGLHALLSCIYEVSTEIQYVRPDGSRDRCAEQLSHLIVLARDEAERIDETVEACITGGKVESDPIRMTGGPRNG